MSSATTMLQVCFPEGEQAELRPVPRDATPLRSDEIAGRTLSSVVSTGTELGMQYKAQDGFPHWPGYGAVFEVEQAGAEAAPFTPGDRAFCIGKHASHQRCRADDAVPVPPELDAVPAVLARMAGIGWSVVTTTQARPPQPVLVIGLGMVGHLAAVIFSRCGYRVGAVDPDAGRRELVRREVAEVFDRVPLQHPEWQDVTNLAVDCSGSEQAVYDACCLVGRGGEVVVAGVPWTAQAAGLSRDLLWKVFWRYVRLRSGWEWEVPWLSTPFRIGSYRENMATTLRWMQSGRLRLAGLYRTCGPQNCQDVYQELLQKRADRLSSVFDWTMLRQ